MGGIDSKILTVPKIRTMGGFESRANTDDIIYEGSELTQTIIPAFILGRANFHGSHQTN